MAPLQNPPKSINKNCLPEEIKRNIRNCIIHNRRQLLPEKRKEYDNIIKEKLFSLGIFNGTGDLDCAVPRVLLYYSFNGETDTGGIFDYLLQKNIEVFFPAITGKGEMDFYRVKSCRDFQKGSFGIMEPVPVPENLFVPGGNDICIVPLVAFDGSLNRLGYGGGYYDRFFDKYYIRNRIGLAYSLQRVDNIPVLATDIKLTGIVTEEGIYG